MPTAAEREKVAAILDRFVERTDPTPLNPDMRRRFQGLCLDEARRLMAFLEQRLSKEARKHIEDRALHFASFAFRPSLTQGELRTLAPMFKKTFAQLNNLE